MVQMSGGLPFDAATVARINIEGCGFKLQHPARAMLCFAHGVILQSMPGRAPGWVYWVGYKFVKCDSNCSRNCSAVMPAHFSKSVHAALSVN